MRANPWPIEQLEGLALEGAGELSRFYPQSAAGEADQLAEQFGLVPYYGRGAVWLGEEGRMVRAEAGYTTPMPDNIFDADKLDAVAAAVDSGERPVFVAPLANASVIDASDVKESLEYWEQDGWDRPYTTGDPELDEFLRDPEGTLSEYPAGARRSQRRRLERELKEAEAAGAGDLGRLEVRLRDGNHRAFGAFLGGERYIYVMLTENLMQDVRRGDYAGAVRLREHLE